MPILPHINLAGQTIGRLTVIDEAPSRPRKNGNLRYWNCVCSCGTQVIIPQCGLRSGHSKSCGCLQREVCGNRRLKHGMYDSSTYCIWEGIIRRCTKQNDKRHHDYMDRGITVCDSWLTFSNFLNDMGIRPEGMLIDRIDNDGPYAPWNCRWVDRCTSQNNRRNTFMVEYQGKQTPISDVARAVKMHRATLRQRAKQGMTAEQAMQLPFKITEGQ